MRPASYAPTSFGDGMSGGELTDEMIAARYATFWNSLSSAVKPMPAVSDLDVPIRTTAWTGVGGESFTVGGSGAPGVLRVCPQPWCLDAPIFTVTAADGQVLREDTTGGASGSDEVPIVTGGDEGNTPHGITLTNIGYTNITPANSGFAQVNGDTPMAQFMGGYMTVEVHVPSDQVSRGVAIGQDEVRGLGRGSLGGFNRPDGGVMLHLGTGSGFLSDFEYDDAAIKAGNLAGFKVPDVITGDGVQSKTHTFCIPICPSKIGFYSMVDSGTPGNFMRYMSAVMPSDWAEAARASNTPAPVSPAPSNPSILGTTGSNPYFTFSVDAASDTPVQAAVADAVRISRSTSSCGMSLRDGMPQFEVTALTGVAQAVTVEIRYKMMYQFVTNVTNVHYETASTSVVASIGVSQYLRHHGGHAGSGHDDVTAARDARTRSIVAMPQTSRHKIAGHAIPIAHTTGLIMPPAGVSAPVNHEDHGMMSGVLAPVRHVAGDAWHGIVAGASWLWGHKKAVASAGAYVAEAYATARGKPQIAQGIETGRHMLLDRDSAPAPKFDPEDQWTYPGWTGPSPNPHPNVMSSREADERAFYARRNEIRNRDSSGDLRAAAYKRTREGRQRAAELGGVGNYDMNDRVEML